MFMLMQNLLVNNKVTILGAGIAGLVCGLFLAKAGFKVCIFEKAKNLKEVGAGIQLAPNASWVLDKLGILDKITNKAVNIQNIKLIDGYNHQTLTQLPVKDYVEKYKLTPNLSIHRADLQNILLGEIEQHANINLTLNCETTPNSSFIAANGIWSSTRRDKAIFSGYIAWRATINNNIDVLPNVAAYLGTTGHVVAYPISNNMQYNIVAITQHKTANAQWNINFFSDWHKSIQDLLCKADDYIAWPIYTMPTTKFIEENCVLIGDAAHGFLPFSAQGASMAIEDAALLSKLLCNHKDNPAYAVKLYAAERSVRIAKVKRRNKFNAMVYHNSTMMRLARNIILKHSNAMGLLHNLNWLYNYKAI